MAYHCLSVYRKTGVVVNFTFSGEKANVHFPASILVSKLERLFVMIQAFFAGINEFRHHAANNRCIFVLVTGSTDSHVETRQIRLVIDGNPVIREKGIQAGLDQPASLSCLTTNQYLIWISFIKTPIR